MKRILVLTILAAALSFPLFAEYPPEGWTDDIREAVEQAESEDKYLILNFTGSDWCGWCMKLGEEVFFTDEYMDWAEKNAVQVFLDFPNTIELDDRIRRQNATLQQVFNIQGYPTILVFDSDLIPRLQTGYQAGGPTEYIRHITEEQNLSVESPEDFRNGFLNLVEEL